MNRDIVIIVEGGFLLGSFSGGVLGAFEEADIYSRIHSIYSCSSGAHASAYFLSKKIKKSYIEYFKKLTDKKVISSRNLFRYLFQIADSKIKKKDSIIDILNLNYIINIEKNDIKIDVDEIKNSEINLYIKVFNIKKYNWEFLKADTQIFEKLKATSSATPFYHKSVKINKKEYIDGDTIRNKDFLKIIEEHPNKKIIYIMNRKRSFRLTVKRVPLYIYESLLIAMLFNSRLSFMHLRKIFSYINVKDLDKYSNVSLIINKKNMKILSNKPKDIKDLYDYGFNEGRKQLSLMGINLTKRKKIKNYY